jgi:hypothetical protein
MTCWVCGMGIEAGDASSVPATLPHRYRAHAGARIHLRCYGEWRHLQVPPPQTTAATKPVASLGAGFLFAEDIAHLRGISRWQARRWLEQLEDQHGALAVGRVQSGDRTRRYTTEAALELVGPRASRQSTDILDAIESLLARVAALEDRIAAL